MNVPRMPAYTEKIERTKTSDISLLERSLEQIVTSIKIFKPYVLYHTYKLLSYLSSPHSFSLNPSQFLVVSRKAIE